MGYILAIRLGFHPFFFLPLTMITWSIIFCSYVPDRIYAKSIGIYLFKNKVILFFLIRLGFNL